MASAHCAAELRRRGADGSILLVGREPEPPYDRPPLSKEYLRGEAGRDDAYVHPPDWYERERCRAATRQTNVMSLDIEARTAKLQGEQEVGFEQGADRHRGDGQHPARGRAPARRDPLPAGVRQLRRDPGGRSAGSEHVVLIGGSYIGAEVAASLVRLGKRCTIVMLEEVVLSQDLRRSRRGRYFHDLLESEGRRDRRGEDAGGVRRCGSGFSGVTEDGRDDRRRGSSWSERVSSRT